MKKQTKRQEDINEAFSDWNLYFCISPNLALTANFATCILEYLPDVQNRASLISVVKMSVTKFPGKSSIKKGSGRGLFEYKSGSECTVDKASKTHNDQAANFIVYWYNCLYDKENYEGETCINENPTFLD